MLNRNLLIVTFIAIVLSFQITGFAQKTANTQINWEDKLYEKNVDYENSACRVEDQKAVADFFKKNPLNRIIRVCHNNCAILESFANRSFPPFSLKIKGTGFIAIHVLANPDGRPIFARAVNGNSLMRKLVEKRACESKFKPNPENRQNIIYFCPVDNCTQPQPVQQ
jgi:hypothetical protein